MQQQQFVALVADVIGFGWMTLHGRRELRRLPARPAAGRVFVLGEGLLLAISVAGALAWAPLIYVAAAIGGMALWLADTKLIDLTGGVLPVVGLARAYADLGEFASRNPRTPVGGSDRAWLEKHLAGLERWRSPETNAFIDLWRAVATAQYIRPEPDPTTWHEMNEQLVEYARHLTAPYQPVKSRL